MDQQLWLKSKKFKMKIKRAVKCAGIESQIKNAIEVAQRADIFGLEIHALTNLLLEKPNFKERGDIVLKGINGYPISSLVYHFPMPSRKILRNLEKVRKYDFTSNESSFIFKLTEETIKEAAFVGKALKITEEIPIIIHLNAFVSEEELNLKERERRLNLGEKALIKLKKLADQYSQEFGVNLVIARENHSPCYGGRIGLLDFSPEDTIKTAKLGIRTVLDFAHIWMNILYHQQNKTNFPGVNFNKKIYPNVDLDHIIDLLAPSLKVLHLNDAGPKSVTAEFEGLEIGTGSVPHKELITLICKKVKNDIIGTYEIIDGHINPEKIFRSDLYYRNLFKDKFNLYFE